MDAPDQLLGQYVRLERLATRHVPGLVAAAEADPSVYRWSPVPHSEEAVREYVETAVAWREAGTAVPFAIVSLDNDVVVGSTRFWNVERWAWPEGHRFHGRSGPDVTEIGYTWLAAGAIRTVANTAAKQLMLTYAFEQWGVHCTCFHTDVRNEPSRRALDRIGAKFDGVLRAHRMAADGTVRDSARYSILASEWPAVNEHLRTLLRAHERYRGEAEQT